MQPPPRPGAPAGTEQYWAAEERRAFPLSRDYVHFNTGTTGSQPHFSLVNLLVYNLYKSLDPRDWKANLNRDFPELFPFAPSGIGGTTAIAARQAAIAALYGANPDEIVLSYNTTDAANLQQHPDAALNTALTSFNPFVGREDSSRYAELSATSTSVVNALALETPKIYARTVTWRDRPSDTADNRFGFRLSTHAVYNSFEEIDHVVERLGAAVDATGLPQLA